MLEKIKDKTAKITIVGMGYIGLPTSIAFAETGYEVYGYDVNEEVINTLKNGKIHIKEPDLQQSFEKVLNSKKLIPTNKLEKSDVFIICVPTPFIKKENKKLSDITYVEKAAKEISSFVEKDTLVILESTVPPMTTDEVVGKIIESETNLKLNEDFLLSYCPERVLPGRILYELKNNDRIFASSGNFSTMNHGSTARQCPPTPAPGLSIFTLGCLLANSINSNTLIPILSAIIESSLANAIFTSL